MLRIEELAVHREGSPAVRGASLQVSAGEVAALVGPPGAGKTTLMEAVAGFLPAAGGSFEIDGRDGTGRAPHEIARAGLSYVAEEPDLFEGLTVGENLRLALRRAPRRRRKDERLQHALDLLPRLRTLTGEQAGSLAEADQRALALARVLCSAPRVLLVDLPPSDDDAPELAPLTAVLHHAAAEGSAVLVGHRSLTWGLRHAQRIFGLADGRVVVEGPNRAVAACLDLAAARLAGRYVPGRAAP